MSFRKLKLAFLIPAIMITLAVFNAGSLGVLSNFQAEEAVMKVVEEKISMIRLYAEQEISIFIRSNINNLILYADSTNTRQELADFSEGWVALAGVNQKSYLQGKYIDGNPNPAGKKQLLDDAGDGSVYSSKHAFYHKHNRDMAERYHYYDMFLVNADGNVVYTLYKEKDFAINLQDADYKDLATAKLFQQMKDKPVKDQVYFSDIAPYAIRR